MQATTGDMRIDAVARVLVVTPRTLQRRLARASFETLRDDARRQAAEAYLSNARLSITEVTYLLGYSESTAFHRAFERWHRGVTPQEFRAKALASADTDVAVKPAARSIARIASRTD